MNNISTMEKRILEQELSRTLFYKKIFTYPAHNFTVHTLTSIHNILLFIYTLYVIVIYISICCLIYLYTYNVQKNNKCKLWSTENNRDYGTVVCVDVYHSEIGLVLQAWLTKMTRSLIFHHKIRTNGGLFWLLNNTCCWKFVLLINNRLNLYLRKLCPICFGSAFTCLFLSMLIY